MQAKTQRLTESTYIELFFCWNGDFARIEAESAGSLVGSFFVNWWVRITAMRGSEAPPQCRVREVLAPAGEEGLAAQKVIAAAIESLDTETVVYVK